MKETARKGAWVGIGQKAGKAAQMADDGADRGADLAGARVPDARSAAGDSPVARPRRRLHHRLGRVVGRLALWLATATLTLALLAGAALLLLAGRPVALPDWAVARIESDLNARLATDAPTLSLGLGGAEVMVEGNLSPRLRLLDARLSRVDAVLIDLPELRLTLDLPALLTQARLRPSGIFLSGLDIALTRGVDGSIDIGLGLNAAQGPPIRTLSDAFARIDTALAVPLLAGLSKLEVEGATLSLNDLGSGRTFVAGDGRVVVDLGADRMAAELALSLMSGGQGGDSLGQAVVTLSRDMADERLRVSASFNGIHTRDLAAEVPILAPLGAVDAPVSGRLQAEATDAGSDVFDAELALGAGVLQPRPDVAPVPFDAVHMAIAYDASKGQVLLRDLSLQSPVAQITATGQAAQFGADGAAMTGPIGLSAPARVAGRLVLDAGRVDPSGVFAAPLVVSGGEVDFDLTLSPFTLVLQNVRLAVDDGQAAPPVITASAKVRAVENGWEGAAEAQLTPLPHDRLLALWPQTAVPKTREWLVKNVLAGQISNLVARVTLAPGAKPQASVSFDFAGAEVRFLRALPPITGGAGRGEMQGKTFRIDLAQGTVNPGDGGAIDVAGSTYTIPDVTQKPADARVDLVTQSSLRATLTLLDLPPFGFLAKANQTPQMAEGTARTSAVLTFPLKPKLTFKDVVFAVTGDVGAVTSDRLVKGKELAAQTVTVAADNTGLTLSGDAVIGAIPFDFAYRQDFGEAAKDGARVKGSAPLSQALLDEFSIRLPDGLVQGKGRADFDLRLKKGDPPVLRLTSDLSGITMALDALGWGKGEGTKGELAVTARLTTPPQITELSLDAAGLQAKGGVSLRDGGGLDVARFSQVSMQDWFDGPVDLIGNGEGRAIDIAVRGGVFDLRRFDPPDGAGGNGAAAGSLTVQLDELRVTDSYFLRGVEGSFGFKGGFNGTYRGSLNGETAVTGAVVPARHGTAVRLQSADAGAALAAAGVFTTARGGTLDLAMTPRPAKGEYSATVEIRDIRARKTNALAELLSAVSVVGLLEQLQGTGILFNRAVFDLIVTPRAVEISSGSATGASIGLSVAGLYGVETKRLDLQGVLSPVYLLNGVGEAFTQRGEGVFGFNYRIGGTSDAPEVSVNPLSVLTPGIFREIFRSGPPKLGEQGG